MNPSIKKINTLAELQEQKQRLRQEINFSKEELIRSLDTSWSSAKGFALKKILIPAGLLGLTTVGIKAMQSFHQESAEEIEEEAATFKSADSSSKWYIQLLPVLFQLVSGFLAGRQNHQHEDLEAGTSESIAAQNR